MVAKSDAPDEKLSKAVALKYEKGKHKAPHLAAKGRGKLAEKIIAIAGEHNIPIKEDADLVDILETVELESEIPLEVYAVVAEIFAYLYKENDKLKATAK